MQVLQLCLFITLVSTSLCGLAAEGRSVTLIGNEGCFESSDAEMKLSQALESRERRDEPSPRLSVAVSKSTSSLNVSLRLTNHRGGLMLSRSYSLSPKDCPEVPDLVVLILEEALKTLPLETWSTEPIQTGAERNGSESHLLVVAQSELNTLSPALVAALKFTFWEESASVPGRAFYALQAGFGPTFTIADGSAQELSLLIGLGISGDTRRFHWSGQLLAGIVNYRGVSIPTPTSTLLPYLEATTDLGLHLGSSTLALRVGMPVLRHTLRVEGQSSVHVLNPVRLGLGFSVPL